MSVIPVLGCTDLDEMVEFVAGLGGRVESISPADAPREVMMSLAGTALCIRREDDVGTSRLIVRRPGAPETVEAPNGTAVEFRPESSEVVLPSPVPTLSVVTGDHEFGVGRAGMEYRDLLPDRWGGRFIASHIVIADGGEVPDYVHFHRVRFQMIFCARGWVELVYEDQGEPFRLHAGDCVLQPPEIRHRVLRSSPGLEVVEIGCPAVHDTLVEHELGLPTAKHRPDRSFGGQRFVRHIAVEAHRTSYLVPGLEVRDTGIGAATEGLAGALVVEAGEPTASGSVALTHRGEFVMIVILRGSATLSVDVESTVAVNHLTERDAVAIPPGAVWRWSEWDAAFEFLEVSLGANAVTTFGSDLAFSD